MTRSVCVLALSLTIGLLIADRGQAGTVDCSTLPNGFQIRQFNDESGSHKFALFLPENYSSDRKWPVVLFLHGAGEKGSDGHLPISGTLAVALEQWKEAPFIAVFPQCEDVTGRSLTGWLADSPDGQRAMRILDQVERDYSVDSSRRVLAGWSMGGYGTWSLAAAHPKHWSSVLVLAGGAVPGTVDLHGLAEARTPVWGISGKQDPLVSFEASQQLIAQLNELGGNGHFTLLSPAGHNICPQVFAERKVFDWLFNPSAELAASVSFEGVKPLPLNTQFYRHCQLHERRVPEALALRLGNSALSELARGMIDLIPPESLQGDLADIRQQVGRNENPWMVSLNDLHYQAHVSQFKLHAISGGRLGMEIQLHPLTLMIGSTRLESRDHFAASGPTQIDIGLRQPAILKLEVQPEMRSGRVRLIPLRQSFLFDEGNWHITPPEQMEVRSSVYTADQMRTGLVGSLYESRQQLTEQVLSVVPKMLETIEEELDFRSAPALARVLSPVPALVPQIEVGPSAVAVDSQGISIICDLKALSRVEGSSLPIQEPWQIEEFSNENELVMGLALEAVTQLTMVNVQQNVAQVNVLDISDDKFSVLADPVRMKQVLPELDAETPGELRTILRLLSPLSLTESPAGNPEQAESQQVHLMLSAERVCLEIYDLRKTKQPVPVGRILFRMSQPMTLSLDGAPSNQASSETNGAVTVQWHNRCEVTFLGAESLAGSSKPQVNEAAFVDLFRDAWLNWGAEHGHQSLSTEVMRFGTARIHLEQIQAGNGRLQFELKAHSEAVTGQ
ncbi:MAG TPA: alpha/beta hydrolase-fold protein [Planctomicrobium sp.]|nr:alpha/beta hydrolase-fold protein [Planctomicrobium sp.]